MKTVTCIRNLAFCWSLAVILALPLLCGCPPSGTLGISQHNLDFASTRTAMTLEIRNTGSGELAWEASAGASWVEVTPAAGLLESGKTATVSINIMRGQLDVGNNATAVEFTSNGGQSTVAIAAEGGSGALSSYWPIEVGNTWNYSLPQFVDLYPEKLGATVFSLSVADMNTVNGLEVWTMGAGVPLLDAAISLWSAFGDEFIQMMLYRTLPGPFVPAKAGSPLLPGPSTQTFYLVAVDGKWYVTHHEEALANLPETKGFLLLDDVLKSPARVLHLLYSGDGEKYIQDVGDILQQMSDDLRKKQGEKINQVEELVPLMTSFGDTFSGYSNPSLIVQGLVRTAAVLTGGADELKTFVDDMNEISEGLADRFQEFQDPLPDYLDTIQQSPKKLSPLLRGFGTRFAAYTNGRDVLADVMSILAITSSAVADILDVSDDYSEADIAAITDLLDNVSRFCTAYGYTAFANFGRFSEAFEDYLDSYPANDATDPIVGLIRDLLPVIEKLVTDVDTEKREARQIGDLLQLQTDLHEFFVTYSDANKEDVLAAFLAEATEVTFESVTAMMAFQPVINAVHANTAELHNAVVSFTAADRDWANAKAAVEAIAGFFDGYAASHPEDSTGGEAAGTLKILAQAGVDILARTITLDAKLDALTLTQRQGELSGFLPIDYDAFMINLADVGVGKQADCIALGLPIPFGGKAAAKGDRWTPVTIYARDVGPVLLGGVFTLQSAVVGDQVYLGY